MSKFFDKITGNKTREEDLSLEEAKIVDANFSIKSYFKLAWAKLGLICKTNLIFILMISPLAFTLFGFAGSVFGFRIADSASSPTDALFAQFSGVAAYEQGSVFNALSIPRLFLSYVNVDNIWTTVLKYLGLLAVIGFGPCNVGCAYIFRNTVKEQPVFVWSDFFSTIKRNLKQSLLFGIVDCFFLFSITYALPFYYANASSFGLRTLFFAMIAISLMYYVMRVYIYLMIVTFDLKFTKLFKNAFILASTGVKRTFMMLLASVAIFAVAFMLMQYLFTFGVVVAFVFLIGFLLFTLYYCAYPVVKKYMIDPYYNEDGSLKKVAE